MKVKSKQAVQFYGTVMANAARLHSSLYADTDITIVLIKKTCLGLPSSVFIKMFVVVAFLV